jgi:hypothetical protein
MRRNGIQLLLLTLPDGSRSLIPAEWTDWPARDAISAPAASMVHRAELCFVPLADLLHIRVIALLGRGPILRPQALNHEESHAVGPCLSRTSPATANNDDRDRCSSNAAGIFSIGIT